MTSTSTVDENVIDRTETSAAVLDAEEHVSDTEATLIRPPSITIYMNKKVCESAVTDQENLVTVIQSDTNLPVSSACTCIECLYIFLLDCIRILSDYTRQFSLALLSCFS